MTYIIISFIGRSGISDIIVRECFSATCFINVSLVAVLDYKAPCIPETFRINVRLVGTLERSDSVICRC